jgi:hypothetical protein
MTKSSEQGGCYEAFHSVGTPCSRPHCRSGDSATSGRNEVGSERDNDIRRKHKNVTPVGRLEVPVVSVGHTVTAGDRGSQTQRPPGCDRSAHEQCQKNGERRADVPPAAGWQLLGVGDRCIEQLLAPSRRNSCRGQLMSLRALGFGSFTRDYPTRFRDCEEHCRDAGHVSPRGDSSSIRHSQIAIGAARAPRPSSGQEGTTDER